MRRFATYAGLCCGFAFVLFFVVTRPVSAKALCQCTCVDSSETTSLLRLPKSGTTAAEKLASCKTEVCGTACTDINSTQVEGETEYNATTNRCICACQATVKKTAYRALSAGKTECLGDCSTACGGQANVFQDATTPKIVDAPCVPGQSVDCKTGAFKIYDGVTCVLQKTTEQGWPNNQKPACIVPITQKNANLECKTYGGIAKGGSCGAVASGESPTTYYKSRPYVKTDGTYATYNFTADEQYGTYALWDVFLDNDSQYGDPKKIPPEAGICYQLGAKFGGQPSYEGFENASPGIPMYDYVCLKKKSNLCGHIEVPATYIGGLTTPESAFTCQNPVDYASKFPNYTGGTGNIVTDTCLPNVGMSPKTNQNYADACASLPNYRCCPSKKPGACLFDKDCSLDGSKTCDGEDVLKFQYGTCVWNTVCDTEHYQTFDISGKQYTIDQVVAGNLNQMIVDTWKTAPWTYDIRGCRPASPQELADPNVCSGESPLPSAPRRCPISGQSCCRASNTKALSSCTSDLTSQVDASGFWSDFTCIPLNQIPQSEYVPGTSNVKSFPFNPTAFNPASTDPTQGNCIQSDMPKLQGGQTVGSQPRCQTGQLCCYYPKIKTAADAQEIALDQTAIAAGQQTQAHGECAPKAGPSEYQCYTKIEVAGISDAYAQGFGFSSQNDLINTMAGSKNCVVTPVEGNNNPFNNKECGKTTTGDAMLCCRDDFFLKDPCANDEVCNGGNACNPTTTPNCKKCHPEYHYCVLASDVKELEQSDSCFVRALAIGESSAKEVANATAAEPKTFTCQAVFAETLGVNEKCLSKGCEELNESGEAAPGTSYRCCIPGVGQSAAAAAQAAAEAKKATGEVQVKAAPYSIALPACIASGNCTLNDIVYTGAAFANFLIGISGSVFLAIFVYGGFLYLTAGSSDRAAKGKKMIIQSTVAMVLILGAFIFISFIQTSLVGSGAGSTTKAKCGTTEKTKNYACTFLSAPPEDAKAITKEVEERKCEKGLCPGPSNYVCCPQ
ncbi:MAG TPA: pilin [Candidatus Methylomirabilis sp.]|nr:pilin [Candidatus Methylomirabilis sp.]